MPNQFSGLFRILWIPSKSVGTTPTCRISFAVVYWIVGVGVNESASGNKRGTLHIGKLIGSRRRWKHVWKDEKSNRNTKCRTKHSAKYEDREDLHHLDR